jgi:phosphotransferase system enzyme I (PtsI)
MVLAKVSKSQEFKGIPASQGITIGKAFLVDKEKLKIPQIKINYNDVPDEVEKFYNCINSAIEEVMEIKEKILQKGEELYKEEILLLDMQLLLLNDSMITTKTIEIIKDKKINSEWALSISLEEVLKKFDAMDDPYISERRNDINFVFQKVLNCLMGRKYNDINEIKKPVILIGHDFSPAETIQMNFSKIKGFITEVGSKTSHTAIIARSNEIPAVVGIGNITDIINGGDDVIIDGFTGTVYINPEKEVINKFVNRKKEYEFFINKLIEKKDREAITKDGYKVKIYGNIEMPSEIESVLEHGGEGIGLFRTEYLYLNKDKLPTEDDHFEVYKGLVEKIPDKEIVIRTLDVGGDKFLKNYNELELNPAMGLRAIRFCLKERDIFKSQLKGILRAAVFGNIKLLIPMVSGIKEIFTIKTIIAECKKELEKENKKFKNDIELGVMVEIPSIAVISDIFAKYVDFFSIGTNDLIQYTLAIDRLNQDVSYLYEPAHPAVLRLIESTVNAAKNAKIPIAMCGEMAGESLYIPILLALKIDTLSMNPVAIPFVKEIICNMTLKEAEEIYNKIKILEECSLIEKTLKYIMQEKFRNFEFIF